MLIFFNGNSAGQSIVQNGNFSTITVNGRTIQSQGNNVSIIGDKIIIDGKEVEDFTNSLKNVKVIINGDCGSIQCNGSVEVMGIVDGNIVCGGNCTCGDVNGDVDCGGNCQCGDVEGDIDAGGSVYLNR